MKKFIKKMAVAPKGLHYKLMIAFSLMSIIPLLVCVYLVNIFIFPQIENLNQVSVIVLLSIAVALLGLVLAKKLVDPVVDMALEAKIIASGDYKRKISIKGEDEIGELGKSINSITKRIKEQMTELHSYSLRTKDINIEIQRKIMALSSLLQIGDMIAASEDIGRIKDLVTEKISEIFKDSFAALYILKEGTDELKLAASRDEGARRLGSLEFRLGKGYLGRSVGVKIITLIDATTKMNHDLETVQNDFYAKNCLIVPIVVRKGAVGFLMTGNRLDNFKYQQDDIELSKVLAKQIGIAFENNLLLHKAEELAFKDDLTGLFNESFIKDRLDEEIHRAVLYQRPCSFLIFNIDDFNIYRDARGEMATEELLKKIADIFKEYSTEIGKAARLGGDEFAVLLPEKNKKEAFEIAEAIRQRVKKLGDQMIKSGERRLTVSGGVSENPIDGSSAEELFNKAYEALKLAKEQGKNKVVA